VPGAFGHAKTLGRTSVYLVNQRAAPLVFIHIPKTAGTSFKHRLLAEYGSSAVGMVYKVEDRTLALREALRQDFKAITGHFGMGEVEAAHDGSQPIRLFSLVRDPLNQTVSHFLHRQRQEVLGDRSEVFDKFEAFLQSPPGSNVQSLLLSGIQRADWASASNEQIWTGVLERWSRFELIGTTEDYEKSLVLVRRQMGWPKRKPEHRNPVRQREWAAELSEHFRARILEANLLDQALHARAAQGLEEAFSKLPAWRRWFG